MAHEGSTLCSSSTQEPGQRGEQPFLFSIRPLGDGRASEINAMFTKSVKLIEHSKILYNIYTMYYILYVIYYLVYIILCTLYYKLYDIYIGCRFYHLLAANVTALSRPVGIAIIPNNTTPPYKYIIHL